MIIKTLAACAAAWLVLTVADSSLPFVGRLAVFVAFAALGLGWSAHVRLDKIESAD